MEKIQIQTDKINVPNFPGWLGYTDEYRRSLCKEYLAQGFDAFKLKVGQNLEDDRHRCRLVREEIGWDNKLVSHSPWVLQTESKSTLKANFSISER